MMPYQPLNSLTHTKTATHLFEPNYTIPAVRNTYLPYQDDLIDFIDIPPKSFHAANKQSFSATGTRNLIVDLPNSKEPHLCGVPR